MRKDDLIRIRHMLDAAKEAVAFLKGNKRKDLEENRMLALSIIKAIELIGEAASRVSTETRVLYSNIPWTVIVAMRNRLIHAYFDIDLDRVWDTVFCHFLGM